MAQGVLRNVLRLPLEEKILNGGSVAALIGVLSPWISGEWLGGEMVSYTGLGFYTSFIGIAVLFLHLYLLLISVIPLTGGPCLVRKERRQVVRLFVAVIAMVVVLSGLSVLTHFTFDFSRMQIRFGVYLALAGSLVSALYAFLLLQEQKKSQVNDLFHHLDEQAPAAARTEEGEAHHEPSEPEEHRFHR